MNTPLPSPTPRRTPLSGGQGKVLLALLLLLPVLAGCSGTRFGDALSRSFSSADPAGTGNTTASPGTASPAGLPAGGTTPTPAPSGAGPSTAGAGAATAPSTASNGPAAGARPGKPAAATAQPSTAGPGPGVSPAASNTASAATTPGAAAVTPPRPAPYRVTILLPQADAAAPAEVVTQALRAAGVPFEVETIERIGGTASSPAASSRPAPPPR